MIDLFLEPLISRKKKGADYINMKTVIWFSPVLLPEMIKFLGLQPSVRAGWIQGLLMALRQYIHHLNIIVVAVGETKKEQRFVVDGVTYHILPYHMHCVLAKSKHLLRAKQLIKEYEVDMVHVHGTESFFSCLACDVDVDVPVCVSIQGLLSKCIIHVTAGLTWKEIVKWQSDWRTLVFRQGPIFTWTSWRRQARREQKVLKSGKFYIGRTQWDRVNVLARNPMAHYLHGGEVLRNIFYQDVPRMETSGKPIILLGRASPIKGITVFIEMLDILRRRSQPFEARIFGQFREKDGLGRVLLSRVRKYGLEDCISFLGNQNEIGVARELAQATVFVHPSFMDNSPNSICEAMMLGTPVIATYCGGVPSLIKDGETGILVPPGDAESLAEATIALLNDATQRIQIAKAAQSIAKRRHHMETLANDYWNIYLSIMRISSKCLKI